MLILLTVAMGWQSQYARMSYKFGGVLPENDSTYIDYKNFIEQFSEDGNVLAIGYRDPRIWELPNFLKWRQLVRDLQSTQVEVDGTPQNMVDSIFSTGNCYNLVKDTLNMRFEFRQLFEHEPQSQAELDSIRNVLSINFPFTKVCSTAVNPMPDS